MSARHVTWDDGYGEPRTVPAPPLDDAELYRCDPFDGSRDTFGDGTRLGHQYAVQPKQDRHAIRSRRGSR